MIDIELYVEQKKEMVDRALLPMLPPRDLSPVAEAMRYSVEAGGKRLRPIMTLATAETLGLEESSVIEAACALELIHTYSLIHDDLPAMDNSDLRRGKPTCHRVFGEAVAVLAGDALLTLAFQKLAAYSSRKGFAVKALAMIHELAVAAGVDGMIGGQVLDLKAENEIVSRSEVDKIAAMKTGALLVAAVRIGAIAADATEEQLNILTVYASRLGIAFQIIDDLLDLESTSDVLGKPAAADGKLMKASYPVVLGPKAARRQAEYLFGRAVTALKGLDMPVDILTGLAKKLVFRIK